MTLEREDERLREAFATRSPEAPQLPDCLSPEVIWEAVNNELDPQDSRRVLCHVAECSSCTEAWRLARALGELPEPTAHRQGKVAMAAAAAVALVLGLAVAVPRWTSRSATTTRTSAGESLELTAPQPMPRSQCVLRWSPVDGAAYDIRIMTEDFDTLATAEGLLEPEYMVRQADLAAVSRGERLFIYVKAHRLGEGKVADRTSAFDCTG